MQKRQGSTKPISEINDICQALKTLAENEVMPRFIATNNMIMQTTFFNVDLIENNNDVVANRLKILEDTISTALRVVTDKETMTDTIRNRRTSIQEDDNYV